mmetsp:Transcript_46590/g.116034  ORF Transcript_46590/g.116034 Transcript_46590/m.116034 type:complete len:273 (+) Transcript_46590:513-1331(+)
MLGSFAPSIRRRPARLRGCRAGEGVADFVRVRCCEWVCGACLCVSFMCVINRRDYSIRPYRIINTCLSSRSCLSSVLVRRCRPRPIHIPAVSCGNVDQDELQHEKPPPRHTAAPGVDGAPLCPTSRWRGEEHTLYGGHADKVQQTDGKDGVRVLFVEPFPAVDEDKHGEDQMCDHVDIGAYRPLNEGPFELGTGRTDKECDHVLKDGVSRRPAQANAQKPRVGLEANAPPALQHEVHAHGVSQVDTVAKELLMHGHTQTDRHGHRHDPRAVR